MTNERTETHACDYISRQAAIDAIDKEYRCTDHSDDWDGLKTAMLIIENLPSAQPERKTGRWIPTGKDTIFGVDVRCSVCGESFATTELAEELYCRHCGAHMGGGEDGSD